MFSDFIWQTNTKLGTFIKWFVGKHRWTSSIMRTKAHNRWASGISGALSKSSSFFQFPTNQNIRKGILIIFHQDITFRPVRNVTFTSPALWNITVAASFCGNVFFFCSRNKKELMGAQGKIIQHEILEAGKQTRLSQFIYKYNAQRVKRQSVDSGNWKQIISTLFGFLFVETFYFPILLFSIHQ